MPEYHWINEEVFTVSDFFTSEECDRYIELAESIGFDEAPITTAFGPQLRKDVRNNSRVMLDDCDLAGKLWRRISDYVPRNIRDTIACGINERFRFYRYDIGQQFDWHYDGCYERDSGERSRLTFMVYLNDDFTGGETTLDNVNVVPEKGLALSFVHQIRHKGQPVIAGRKYVLRSDVMYRTSCL